MSLMKYTAISYNDVKVKTWTAPQFFPGVEEESVNNFVQNIERAKKLGRISPENQGIDCYKIGVFDDETGIYTCCQPEFLVRLENLI